MSDLSPEPPRAAGLAMLACALAGLFFGFGFFGQKVFFRRGFLRSHRPLEITVVDRQGQRVIDLSRPFFWLFSTLDVLMDRDLAEVIDELNLSDALRAARARALLDLRGDSINDSSLINSPHEPLTRDDERYLLTSVMKFSTTVRRAGFGGSA